MDWNWKRTVIRSDGGIFFDQIESAIGACPPSEHPRVYGHPRVIDHLPMAAGFKGDHTGHGVREAGIYTGGIVWISRRDMPENIVVVVYPESDPVDWAIEEEPGENAKCPPVSAGHS